MDGFDPKDETSISDIYGVYLQYTQTDNFGNDMRDEGYDIIVLNFPKVLASTINVLLYLVISPFLFIVMKVLII